MPYKMSENISKSLDFSWFSGATDWDQSPPREGGGTKETCRGEFLQQCRFLVVFGGKQEVGDQSSPTEYE